MSVSECPHRCPEHDLQAVEAACWREEFTEERVRERLAEADALVLRRLRLASLDVSAQPMPRHEPWPEDARVPHGFYPPRGAA